MDEIPRLDLNDRDVRRDPYPVYRWYRENCPVFHLGSGSEGAPERYMLTRFSDISKLLRSKSLLRGVYDGAFWNRSLTEIPEDLHLLWRTIQSWPIYLDPPGHSKPRRAINRSIGRDSSVFLETIREVCDQLVAELPEHGPMDAIGDFASRIPAAIACRLFGIETISSDELREEASTIALALSSRFDREQRSRASESVARLSGALQESVDRTRSCPFSGASWMSGLVDAVDQEGIVDDEMIVPLALQMIIGAADTTANLVGNGIYTFLRFPAELKKFLDGPKEEYDYSAPREVARFESPVQHVMRHSAEAIRIGETEVPANSAVCFVLGAANRDPEFVSDPEVFSIDRSFDDSLSFGHGLHKCPGKDFALHTAAVAWRSLFRRFPRMVLVQKEFEWFDSIGLRGLTELQVVAGRI